MMNLFDRMKAILKRTSPLESLEKAECFYVLYRDNQLKCWVLHDKEEQKNAVITFLDVKKAEAFLEENKEAIEKTEIHKYEKGQWNTFLEEIHSAGVDVLLIGKNKKFWKYEKVVHY